MLPSKTQGIYPDAFEGGIVADILYENSPSGFEQSIIIRSQLPPPSQWSLDPSSTVLQVITEFTNFPPPQITQSTDVRGGNDDIDFGSMQMGHSAAFALGDETNRIAATKRWVVLDGRQCLLEQIPYPSIADLLQQLPPPPPGHASLSNPDSILRRAVFGQALPRHKSDFREPPAFTLAQAHLGGRGLVADYQQLNSQGSLTLQGDTTYYVANTVSVTKIIIPIQVLRM